jgi:hypothetical protein
MPLSDVLRDSGDGLPITATLLENVTQILADGDAAANTYDVGNVLASIIFAIRHIEEEIVTTKELLRLLTPGPPDGT